MAETILIIEDEPGIVDFLQRGLANHGFTVLTETDGIAGAERALTNAIDLIVLDIMLPGRDGFEVLQAVHERKPNLPVIALSARGEVVDRVRGLDLGAVDYIVKPFSLAELVARIRAQLRATEVTRSNTLQAAGIEVDLLKREVRRDGERVLLSTTEFELLAYLMRHHDQVLSRDMILRAVWGYEADPATNVVDVYVGYLRRKLRSPGRPAPIITVRSVGYRFDAGTFRADAASGVGG